LRFSSNNCRNTTNSWRVVIRKSAVQHSYERWSCHSLELIATWTGTFSGMKGGVSQAHPVLRVAAAAMLQFYCSKFLSFGKVMAEHADHSRPTAQASSVSSEFVSNRIKWLWLQIVKLKPKVKDGQMSSHSPPR